MSDLTHARTPRLRFFRRGIALSGTCLTLAAMFVGCASPPPPEKTAEQLQEVTKDDQPAEAEEDLSVEQTPEPVAEPLECTPVLTITVRGTGEPRKRQLVSPIARHVEETYPGMVQTVDLDYPASGDIKEGSTQGIRTLIDTLNQQARLCADQQFVILGYSQGALLIGESLIAPDLRLIGATVGELTLAASLNIAAVVLYADPRFVGSEPFGRGTFHANTNGLLERPAGALDEYADRIVSYCVADDFICQASPALTLDEEGHVAYYSNRMQDRGAAFVIERVREAIPDIERMSQETAESPEPEDAL